MTFDEFLAHRLRSLLHFATVVTCDPDLAEDVLQEVLVRAYDRWRRISAVEQPEAYVKRMVVNEYISWRRRSARVVTIDGEALARLVPPEPDPATATGGGDDLVARIARLTPRQRVVVAMRYYDDRTDAEIAETLGCSEVTVRGHAAKALAALRVDMLAERSVGHDL